jgi:PDZ and LIM domain protein 5/6/7
MTTDPPPTSSMQKPFPDRSFYVFDGKPLCAYHYHEANDSLCAAATCGQPIEGPCAVSHAGDRYHPEHILCEHPGFPKCKERLDDYWEVDGRMLCERHANAAMRADGAGTGEEPQGDQEQDRSRKRAMKRTTRFIDLAGGGALM